MAADDITVVTDFPYQVEVIENTWIGLSDGTQLAARIWLPQNACDTPVPAILEYLPYRKRDGTRDRDELTHPWYAGHGYAAVRVDIRGSGESQGILEDEYLKQEQDDALEILAWIASQDWCTGACGMIGISWGGFNGLQIAARRPPELKAIVTIASTDDRYSDDIHYMGGVMTNDSMSWASTMFGMNTRPPDPALVDNWRELWMARLEANDPWLIKWLHHQRRDGMWKHGSVIENHADIKAAVYAVGGWADGYSNAVPRMLAGLTCPRKGLIGPWAHKYPHFANPGPRIGFLQETLRWWDRWLKGVDNGIMDEPMYRVWMQDSHPPATWSGHREGRWVAEPCWPSPRIEDVALECATCGRLDCDGEPTSPVIIRTPLTMGQDQGEWCQYGLDHDAPGDQRAEDGCSVVFETGPLDDPLEILGAPVVELDVSADRPCAFVAARLCDVAPDGASTRVTYGVLNLTHRDSHEHPEPLEPGTIYRVRVQMNDIAQGFAAGHRIRLALSNAMWPLLLPSPEQVSLTLHRGVLHLPRRPRRADDASLPVFPAPESAQPWKTEVIAPASDRRWTTREVTGEVRSSVLRDGGLVRDPATDWTFGARCEQHFDITENDPASARITITWTWRQMRESTGFDVSTTTRSSLACTRDDWVFEADCEAFENGRRVWARSWNETIPRDLN